MLMGPLATTLCRNSAQPNNQTLGPPPSPAEHYIMKFTAAGGRPFASTLLLARHSEASDPQTLAGRRRRRPWPSGHGYSTWTQRRRPMHGARAVTRTRWTKPRRACYATSTPASPASPSTRARGSPLSPPPPPPTASTASVASRPSS